VAAESSKSVRLRIAWRPSYLLQRNNILAQRRIQLKDSRQIERQGSGAGLRVFWHLQRSDHHRTRGTQRYSDHLIMLSGHRA
jgi:hypothetical protein